MNFAELVTGWW